MNLHGRRVLLVLCLLLIMGFSTGCKKEEVTVQNIIEEVPAEEIKDLKVWYTDETLTSFLEDSILEYERANNVTVTLKLVSLVDYVENLNKASISGEQIPDIFIGSSNLLEKVVLSGLALENDMFEETYNENNYPSIALNAATYQDKLYGYPLSFETSFLLFNKNYISTPPATFDEILAFSEAFEAAEGVQNILKWNVVDIFNDYFFVGNYAQIGGATGDDRNVLDIDNQKVIDAMTYYQNLNQFFFIDPKTVSYDSILQDFIEGKTIFTIVKSDALSIMDEAIAAGNSSVSYGVGLVPDLTVDLQTKGLSETDMLVVNGYTKSPEAAKELARFLSFDKADKLYEKTGKFSARSRITYVNPEAVNVVSQYENSMEVPKLIEAGNYWVKMEIAFANIWAGNDVKTEIQAVSEFMKKQFAE